MGHDAWDARHPVCRAALIRTCGRGARAVVPRAPPPYEAPVESQRYDSLVDDAFTRIYDLFEDIDTDDADLETSAGVVRIEFRGRKQVVINTQRPTQQIWLAGASRGWHFAYDAARDAWVDDRDGTDELFAVLARLTEQAIGIQLAL